MRHDCITLNTTDLDNIDEHHACMPYKCNVITLVITIVVHLMLNNIYMSLLLYTESAAQCLHAILTSDAIMQSNMV